MLFKTPWQEQPLYGLKSNRLRAFSFVFYSSFPPLRATSQPRTVGVQRTHISPSVSLSSVNVPGGAGHLQLTTSLCLRSASRRPSVYAHRLYRLCSEPGCRLTPWSSCPEAMGGGDRQAGRQGTRRSPLQRAAREAHRSSSRGAASSVAEKPKASRDVHPEHPGARRLACSSTPAAVSGEGADVMRQGWIGGGLWSGRRTCLTRSGHEGAGSPNRPGSGILLPTDRST